MRCMGSRKIHPYINGLATECKIRVVVQPPKGHKINQIKHFGKKMRQIGKLLVDEPRNRSGMFRKAQMGLSEVLFGECFDATASCAIKYMENYFHIDHARTETCVHSEAKCW